MSFDRSTARAFTIFILPLLVAMAFSGWQALRNGPAAPVADEILYLSIARELNRSGTFTDAYLLTDQATPTAGRLLAPAYPFFLSAMTRLDPQLALAVDCDRRAVTECPGSLRTIIVAQAGLAAVTIFFIYLIAWKLSGAHAVAWTAMLLAATTGEFGSYAGKYLTETLGFTSLFAFIFFSILAYDQHRKSAALIAGLALGLAILTRPPSLYLFYVAVPCCFVVWYFFRSRSLVSAFTMSGIFAAGAIAVFGSWLLRNYYHFGDFALTKGYAELTLVQRLGYNIISWKEVAAALIAWLPGIGAPLAKVLFSPELYARLGSSMANDFEPLYFYRGDLYWRTLAAAGGPDAHLGYLIRNYVLGDLPKHLAMTLLLALRGMWVGKYLALAGMVLLVPAGWLMHKAKRFTPFMIFVLPLLFLSFFYGFVSTSLQRYHVPMIAAYAFAIALVLVRLVEGAATFAIANRPAQHMP